MNDGAQEAQRFARYVVGRAMTPEAAQRYSAASQRLGYDRVDRVVAFALRNPWSLGPLDGALALMQPDALLRRKLLLATAILETTPEYCDAFLPRDRTPLEAVLATAAALRGALHVLAGLVLLAIVSRRS